MIFFETILLTRSLNGQLQLQTKYNILPNESAIFKGGRYFENGNQFDSPTEEALRKKSLYTYKSSGNVTQVFSTLATLKSKTSDGRFSLGNAEPSTSYLKNFHVETLHQCSISSSQLA